ncbi:MAG: hypothetical protein LBD32_00105, partial [Cytophagales bacterium]|nr:hypothetical protein [Cytophagales bacterium]
RFPELFPKDFTSKVIFSKWDFAAGTVVVSIDQVGPITCKFHDVKGFSSLVIVSNMGVNDTNVVMEFNGVPVTILYNDLQAFQSSCTNLQIFSNHKPFKVKGESGIFKLVNGKNGDPLHYVVFYTKEATGTQVPVKKNEEAAYKSKMLMFNKLMGGIDPRKT